MQLAESEHSEGCHVLAGLHRLEPDERYLHRKQGSEAVESAVGNVNSMGEAAGDHQGKNVERDEVDKEHIATP